MKKCLAIILTLAIFLCAAPLAGFTAIEWPVLNFKNIFPSAKAAEIVASGTCGLIDEGSGLDGSQVTWTLDGDGLLTVGGTGGMRSYFRSDPAPWKEYSKSIKKIIVQGGVFNVAPQAFYDCDAIREVVLENGVVAVDGSAFYDAGGPFTVQIPQSLQSFSDYELRCASAFSVDENNPYFKSLDGVLYNKDMTALIAYPGQKETETFVLPDSVVSVESVFYGWKLKSVTVGKSFAVVGDNPFDSCGNLETIECSPANPVCKSIDGVLFHTDLYDSHEYALCAYPKAKTDESYTVPPQVTLIVQRAIDNYNLKELILPDSIKEIYSTGIDTSKADVTVMNPDCVVENNGIRSARRIIGFAGSTAEAYANEKHITFRAYCPHTDTVVRDVRAAKCSLPGLKGETYCNGCKEVIRCNELIYVDHTDADKNGQCDSCGMEIGDIRLNEEKMFPVLGNGKTQWIRFVPTLTAPYTISTRSDGTDGSIYLYDENKTRLDSWGVNNNFVLESGKTYYFVIDPYGDSTAFTVRLSVSHYTPHAVEELERTCTQVTRAAYTCVLCGETVNDEYGDRKESYYINEHVFEEQTDAQAQTDPHSIQYTDYRCAKCGTRKSVTKAFNATNTVTKIEAIVGDQLIENVSGTAATGYFSYNINEADISFRLTYADGYSVDTSPRSVNYGYYDLLYDRPNADNPWGVGKHEVTAVFYTDSEKTQEYYRVSFDVEVIKNPIKSVKATYAFEYPEGYYYTYRLFPGWVHLQVTYNDDSTTELTADQAKHFSILAQSENEESGFGAPASMIGDYLKAERPGTYTVYAEYMGVKTSFEVTVKAVKQKSCMQLTATEIDSIEPYRLSDDSISDLCKLDDGHLVQLASEWVQVDENSSLRQYYFVIYDKDMKEGKRVDSKIIAEVLQLKNKGAQIIVSGMKYVNGEVFLTVSVNDENESEWNDRNILLRTTDMERFAFVSVPGKTEDAQPLWKGSYKWSIDYAAGQYVLTASEYTDTTSGNSRRAGITSDSRLIYYTSKDLESWDKHFGPAFGKDFRSLALNVEPGTSLIRGDDNGAFFLNSYIMDNGDSRDYETYGLYYTDDFETYQLLTEGIPEKSMTKTSALERVDGKVYFSVVENTVPVHYHFGVAYGCSVGNPYTRTSLFCFDETTKELHTVYTTTDPVSGCVINNDITSPAMFINENGQLIFRTFSGEKGTVIKEGLSPISAMLHWGRIQLNDYAALGWCLAWETDEETGESHLFLYFYDESGKISKCGLIADADQYFVESLSSFYILSDSDTGTYRLLFSSDTYSSNGGSYLVDISNAVTAHLKNHPHVSAEIPAEAATCGAAGRTQGAYCAVCGTVLTASETLDATGRHVWNEGEIKKAPTVTEEGEKLYQCTVCGQTKTETIPKKEPGEQEELQPGDVDGDGEVTSGDARLALRASVQLEKYEPGSAQFLAADVDKNGAIESSDARTILRVSVKLESFR